MSSLSWCFGLFSCLLCGCSGPSILPKITRAELVSRLSTHEANILMGVGYYEEDGDYTYWPCQHPAACNPPGTVQFVYWELPVDTP